MLRKPKSTSLAVLFTLLVSGCGYSTSSLLPSHLKTIYVEPVKNKITYGSETRRNLYYPLLEIRVRDAIVDRFLFDGNLNVAKEEKADLILRAELLNYDREPLRYFDETQEVQEYRIYITVSLELWDSVKEKLMWSESSFTGDTTYFTSGALAKTEAAAVEDALIDVARRVVERTIEDW